MLILVTFMAYAHKLVLTIPSLWILGKPFIIYDSFSYYNLVHCLFYIMCSVLDIKLQKIFKEYLITKGDKRGLSPARRSEGCAERAPVDARGRLQQAQYPNLPFLGGCAGRSDGS